jgi:hypothetical protein
MEEKGMSAQQNLPTLLSAEEAELMAAAMSPHIRRCSGRDCCQRSLTKVVFDTFVVSPRRLSGVCPAGLTV